LVNIKINILRCTVIKILKKKISFILFRRELSWDNKDDFQRVAMLVTTTVFWLVSTKLSQYLKLGCHLLKKSLSSQQSKLMNIGT